MADIVINYLPPTGNGDFDLKLQQLVDLLRTYLSEHDTSLATLESALAWTTISSFDNSWVNVGSPYNATGYLKDKHGFVHLTGRIKDGTVGNSAFTLPTGYRPPATIMLDAISNNTIAKVTIASNGTVTPVAPTDNTWLQLDGLLFYTA